MLASRRWILCSVLSVWTIAEARLISYNLPHLCANATWAVNATTFANSTVVGTTPHGIFIDHEDTVYLADKTDGKILVYENEQMNASRTLPIKLADYTTLFVSLTGDVYFEHESARGRIDKCPSNATNSVFVTTFSGNCDGLFIDINNSLYCSLRQSYRVDKMSLNSSSSAVVTAAGSASNPLLEPWGIFVDAELKLYVADASNNRIQMFRPEQRTGETVAGQGKPNGLQLSLPTDVVMDGDGYLYIADNEHHRIIRSGKNAHTCLVGCSGQRGSTAHELNKAYSVRLSSRGDLYVVDEYNDRIQKLQLISPGCETSTASSSTILYHPLATSVTTVSAGSSLAPSTAARHFERTSSPAQQDIFSDNCALFQPCGVGSTCQNNRTALHGFICICQPGFKGATCKIDQRLCPPNRCSNHGTCNETTPNGFYCNCTLGWDGLLCERKTNYCSNVTCHNRGVCEPSFRHYTCRCLGDSFSGLHCEITATKTIIYGMASKSFAYLSILIIIAFATFIVVMDILTYCFGIDPPCEERRRIRRKKQMKRRRPIIQRFIYVHKPSISLASDAPISSTLNETVI